MFRIGPYSIDSRVILAPMAGVTDRPFRQLCRRLGAGLAGNCVAVWALALLSPKW